MQMNYCLKVGDKYKPEHVHKLAKDIPELICLTEDPSGLQCQYQLLPNFPLNSVWWKMLMFNEKLFPRGSFFDLDIKIRKPLSNNFKPINNNMTLLKTDWEDLSLLSQNTIGNRYRYCSINSSIMAWSGNTHHIWKDFIENHEKIMWLFNGIDTYLEHRWINELSFFNTGLVDSYRCNPESNAQIMIYDGKGKYAYFNDE